MIMLNSSYSHKDMKQSEKKDNLSAVRENSDVIDWTKTFRAGMRTQRSPNAVREKWRSENKYLHYESSEHFIRDCPTYFYVKKQPAEKKKISRLTKSAKLKSKQNDVNETSEKDNSENTSETKSLKE